MMHWQKLAVAGIAALGAAAFAVPASAAPSGLQSLELATADNSAVQLVNHRRHRKHRDRDFDINLGFGFFPFVGGGFYPYGHRHHSYLLVDDSYLHCHGQKYRWKGRIRCDGRWHRHWY